MKKSIFTIVFCFFWAVAVAQNDTRYINNLHQIFLDATVKADSTILNKLCHKNLQYGHSNAFIEGKDSFIGGLIAGYGSYPFINSSNRKITKYAKTAIIRENLITRYVSKQGIVSDLTIMVIYIWIKDKGNWQLVQRQACKIPVA